MTQPTDKENPVDGYMGLGKRLGMANNRQNAQDNAINPSYYQLGKIEVADFILDQNLDFCSGNVVKYICRAGKKDPSKHLEDLQKAEWYLKREIKKVTDADSN